jgi:hypothetical protein
MNWGYKILLVYILFVIGIMWMVFTSSSQKVDLVAPDYYAKELKYQEIIDAAKRAGALSSPVTCNIVNQEIKIIFPKEFAGKKISGEVNLYCPSNENKDILRPFDIRDTLLTIPIPSANKGLHEVQIHWQSDEIKYYFEKKIFI